MGHVEVGWGGVGHVIGVGCHVWGGGVMGVGWVM